MRWTIREDKLIAEALVKNGIFNNKSFAFQVVANTIGVSKKAVEGRYYRNKENIDNFVEDLQNLNSYFKRKIPWYVKLWNAIQSMLNLNQKL